VTLTIIGSQAAKTDPAYLVTCAESLGLPTNARTLFRAAPTGNGGADCEFTLSKTVSLSY
jgi:hypothetical protein